MREDIVYNFRDYMREEHETHVPIRNEVCGRCKGEGSMPLPGVVITQEDWEHDWDEEERDAYMRGDYNQSCPDCGGKRVVGVVDLENASEFVRAQWEEYEADVLDSYAIEAAERRMGA